LFTFYTLTSVSTNPYSPNPSLYISQEIDQKNSFIEKELLNWLIIFQILLTLSLIDLWMTLLGDTRCQSLSGIKDSILHAAAPEKLLLS